MCRSAWASFTAIEAVFNPFCPVLRMEQEAAGAESDSGQTWLGLQVLSTFEMNRGTAYSTRASSTKI